MADSKSFLHNWCAKQKINPPHFDVRPTGKIALATQRQPTETMKHIDLIIYKYLFNFFSGVKNRQRFLCDIRVDGFNYVAVGNSTNKKDAQMNAARDFIQFLIREDKVAPNEVPNDVRTLLFLKR